MTLGSGQKRLRIAAVMTALFIGAATFAVMAPTTPTKAGNPAVSAPAAAAKIAGTANNPAKPQSASAKHIVTTSYAWYFFAYYHDFVTCVYMGVLFSWAYNWTSWKCSYIPYINCYGLYYYAPYNSPAGQPAAENRSLRLRKSLATASL